MPQRSANSELLWRNTTLQSAANPGPLSTTRLLCLRICQMLSRRSSTSAKSLHAGSMDCAVHAQQHFVFNASAPWLWCCAYLQSLQNLLLSKKRLSQCLLHKYLAASQALRSQGKAAALRILTAGRHQGHESHARRGKTGKWHGHCNKVLQKPLCWQELRQNSTILRNPCCVPVRWWHGMKNIQLGSTAL